MPEYISREAAKTIIERLRDKCDNDEMAFALNWASRLIRDTPAADVVERPRWIPVTERLPEKHQWCLVVGENLYDMDFINSRGVWTIHDKPYAPIDYWMPLLEPPKEET